MNIIFIFSISMAVFIKCGLIKKKKKVFLYSSSSLFIHSMINFCCWPTRLLLFTDEQVCSLFPLTNSLTLSSCELLLLYKHGSWKHKHEHLLVCFHRVGARLTCYNLPFPGAIRIHIWIHIPPQCIPSKDTQTNQFLCWNTLLSYICFTLLKIVSLLKHCEISNNFIHFSGNNVWIRWMACVIE